HADFAGIDDDHRRADEEQRGHDGDRVAHEPEQADHGAGARRLERGGGEQDAKGDEKQDGAGDELGHGGSGRGWEKKILAEVGESNGGTSFTRSPLRVAERGSGGRVTRTDSALLPPRPASRIPDPSARRAPGRSPAPRSGKCASRR